MEKIRFDFNNMFDFNIGSQHGVRMSEIAKMKKKISSADAHLRKVISSEKDRINLGLEWTQLPFQDEKTIKQIEELASQISAGFENVLFLGIGGSYLGLKAAQDALTFPYYNEFERLRKKKPRIYFEGNNLDPQTLYVLLKQLEPKKTFVVVISKSGETTETKAAFLVVQDWLKKALGSSYGRQILAITDPLSGSLRKLVEEESAKDKQSFRSLPLLRGVGGRYSELNMGLLHLSLIGIDIRHVLSGAADMALRCQNRNLWKNPAYLYATLHTIQYLNKHKPITIIMPFCEGLKSTADWYCQLLAESTGKKFGRKIIVDRSGNERWLADTKKIKKIGRTPIASRGTNDLHSIQQNNIEGENNKTVTFIRVEKFACDIKIPKNRDFLSGLSYTKLLSLAQEATEWALVRENRPNCTVILPQLSPYCWGGLLYFFEMATAFEAELLNVNAFDQPGVEGYKNYMYYKLNKPGLAEEIADEIRKNPLKKRCGFII
ncbi:MAG: hypothetical protein N2606_04535 [Candidatus Omnitrophica bacterium]|nr:hypothetical protein [Candidatus Omnitrophota bacterium]